MRYSLKGMFWLITVLCCILGCYAAGITYTPTHFEVFLFSLVKVFGTMYLGALLVCFMIVATTRVS